jgi:putative endonuclease
MSSVNSPPSSKRTPAQRRGAWAEDLARQALCAQGLCFVAQNIRCKVGEIDLILWDGPALVFVEVRYRKRSGFGSALDSVDHAKQSRIRRAAQWWLQRHHKRGLPPCRFDVYALDGSEACWVKGAFSA